MHLMFLQRPDFPFRPAEGPFDTTFDNTAVEAGKFGNDERDLCALINDDDLAVEVAHLGYARALDICNRPLEIWQGVKHGDPHEWDDVELKDMRCLGEMVAVLLGYSKCLPPDDRTAICDRVFSFPTENTHVMPSDETIRLCDGGSR
jgi:hypothetical protein